MLETAFALLASLLRGGTAIVLTVLFCAFWWIVMYKLFLHNKEWFRVALRLDSGSAAANGGRAATKVS